MAKKFFYVCGRLLMLGRLMIPMAGLVALLGCGGKPSHAAIEKMILAEAAKREGWGQILDHPMEVGYSGARAYLLSLHDEEQINNLAAAGFVTSLGNMRGSPVVEFKPSIAPYTSPDGALILANAHDVQNIRVREVSNTSCAVEATLHYEPTDVGKILLTSGPLASRVNTPISVSLSKFDDGWHLEW